jgi:hypothetical protein
VSTVLRGTCLMVDADHPLYKSGAWMVETIGPMQVTEQAVWNDDLSYVDSCTWFGFVDMVKKFAGELPSENLNCILHLRGKGWECFYCMEVNNSFANKMHVLAKIDDELLELQCKLAYFTE